MTVLCLIHVCKCKIPTVAGVKYSTDKTAHTLLFYSGTLLDCRLGIKGNFSRLPERKEEKNKSTLNKLTHYGTSQIKGRLLHQQGRWSVCDLSIMALPGRAEEGVDSFLFHLQCGKAPTLTKAGTGSSSLPQNKTYQLKHLNDKINEWSKVRVLNKLITFYDQKNTYNFITWMVWRC